MQHAITCSSFPTLNCFRFCNVVRSLDDDTFRGSHGNLFCLQEVGDMEAELSDAEGQKNEGSASFTDSIERDPPLRSEVNIELNFFPKLRGARSRLY